MSPCAQKTACASRLAPVARRNTRIYFTLTASVIR